MSALPFLGSLGTDAGYSNFLYNPELKRGVLVDFGLAEVYDKVSLNGK